MNIIFLTITRITGISERGIYTDLMREFRNEGHQVYIACPTERKYKQNTNLTKVDGVHILSIKTLNIQKTSLIEKGIGTLLLESQFLESIKKYYDNVKFDLVIYSTPPITFTKVIRYIKYKYRATTYLLLKDIFPQNAVDLGMIKENGIIHRYFKNKEKRLYSVSDYIGCMSPANVDYITSHNKTEVGKKAEVNPNSIEPFLKTISNVERIAIRTQYNIPLNDTVFAYGGNLGKPQGIDFLIDILIHNNNKPGTFFLIVGDGTEYLRLKLSIDKLKSKNILLLKNLPKANYDQLLLSCDVGLIFLDKRFTIPNFPSRLLSYLECHLPVIAATDSSTDIGDTIVKNNFGTWCLNGDLSGFNKLIAEYCENIAWRQEMGNNGNNFMMKNYLVQQSYQTIMKHML
ncbi:glycosyltransferase family 4 protein [Mucilaginibacter boryungensis]|uniref:Glycosyltransferase family 4 protein n=1 Tax=Mucilaginibacter boryungensis TaxID=768480 RepID=A0ABR9XFK5_9SPHI|nr:glycosyltransferase family 4 protein [Mucilaginibacter boryungensis]MBE9665844.1 glycosyltransferase family 4 protein [Mucilaginibacter boryungensis]